MKLALARQKINILFNKFYKCHLKRVQCVDRCNGNDNVKMFMMFQKKKEKMEEFGKDGSGSGVYFVKVKKCPLGKNCYRYIKTLFNVNT